MSRATKLAAVAPPTRRCAIYTRKSTSAGLEMDFNSLDAQREACLAYIARQEGWSVVAARYDDGGFTGANIDRPAFQRLLEDVEAGKIDIVVVYKVDRLSRSLLDFAKLMDRFDRAKAAFVSVTQNFNTADAMGRLTLNMLISFAEFERSMIAERTRDKVVAARKRGKWTGGPVPYGFRVVDGKLAIVDDEARVVRQIFQQYEEHRSLVRILDELARTATTTKTNRPWAKASLLCLLKNPVYAGFTRSSGERFAGEHRAILDAAQFDRVQGLIGRGAPALNKRGLGDSLLRGLAHCSCGATMVVENARRGQRTYRYLRCDSAHKKGSDACKARTRLPLGPIEAHVIDALRAQARDPAFARRVRATLDERLRERRTALTREADGLPQAIGETSARVHALVSAHTTAPEAARLAINKRLVEETALARAQETRLAALRDELDALAGAETEAAWIEQALARFDGMWEALKDANRVALVRAVVDEVVLDVEREQVLIALAGAGWPDAAAVTGASA